MCVRVRLGGFRELVGLGRRGNRRRGVVVGVHEREQVAVAVHGALEDGARALLVARDVVGAARHEEHRGADAGESGGIPVAHLHAPRANRDGRLDARIARLLVGGRAGGALEQQRVGRGVREGRGFGTITAAHDVHHAVAAHRVAEDGRARDIHASGEHAARSGGREPRHFVHDEELIEGAVVERAGEGLLRVVGAVGVVDRHGHVALGREVLAEMAHEEPVPGIAVRDHHERKRRRAAERRRVAHRAAAQRGRGDAVAQHRAVFTAAAVGAGAGRGRVPRPPASAAGRSAPWGRRLSC